MERIINTNLLMCRHGAMPLVERLIGERFSYLDGKFIGDPSSTTILTDVQTGR